MVSQDEERADVYTCPRTSSSWARSPNGTRNRKAECSDSIRSKGLAGYHRFNIRWLKEASRILKPDGTIWVTGTHHIIFSLGFALQRMKFNLINADYRELDTGEVRRILLPRTPVNRGAGGPSGGPTIHPTGF
jgi:hypothetical protein